MSELELVRAPARLLESQRILDRVMRTGHGTFAGRNVSAPEYFGHLRVLVSLLLHVAEPDDLTLEGAAEAAFVHHIEDRARKASRKGYVKAVPREPALVAAVIDAVVHLAEADCPRELQVRMSPWARRLQKRAPKTALYYLGHRYGLTPIIDRAIVAHLRMLRPGGATFERGRKRMEIGTRGWRFERRHVPQLFWGTFYSRLFAELLPQGRPEYGRKFCSLALIKMCWRDTWRNAANALDVTVRFRGFTSGYMCHLTREDTLDVFQQRLLWFARGLGSDVGLVDYQSRRRKFVQIDVVTIEEWTQHCVTSGLSPTQSRRTFATAWIWAELTGNSPVDAPCLAASAWLHPRAGTRLLIKHELSQLEAGLQELAMARLAAAA